MIVKFGDGVKDVNIMDVTADNYIVPDNEKHLFHVKMEQKAFNPNTGARLSRPFVQKFGAKTWQHLKEFFKGNNYTMEVLYDPTEYNKAVEENRASMKQAHATLAEARNKANIDEAVAKALAEQQKKFDAEMQKQIADAVAKAMGTKSRKSKDENKESN